jgi:uncharacterized membrane protein YqjE
MRDGNRSVRTVVSDIVGDLQGIVRAEVRLVRAEIREELAGARRGAMLLTGAAVVLVLSAGLILLALVYALATVWPAWAAALTVAGLAGIVGAALLTAGRKAFSAVALPWLRTGSTGREKIQWAKSQTK